MSTDLTMAESVKVPAPEARYVPKDRESFFDAQRRNRRATWRISILCLISAMLMGIPLALVVTPLLYAVGLIVADIVNYFAPLPAVFWQLSAKFAHFGIVAFQWLLQPRQQHIDPATLVVGIVVMLLPGVLLSMFLWSAIHMMFQRSGVGGALLALKAREPDQHDLKELQLANVVEEMAIASGLPAPKVMLVDSLGANAAVIGTSPQDARVVVSRRLIDDLNRDEMEGVLATLIASVGNGDLHIAFRMTAVFETCGLLAALINSPFGPQSRGVLWRILRYSLTRSSSADAAQEAAAVAEMLSRSAEIADDDINTFFDTTRKKSKLHSILIFILFPIFLTNFVIKLSLWFFSATALGPSLALLWHTRRFLADATAVQLTRNPDGLASALQKLTHEPGDIPGGDWASHLFFVKPAAGSGRTPDRRQREVLAEAWTMADANPSAAATPPAKVDFAALQAQFAGTLRAAMGGDEQAQQKLRAMYHSVAATDPALAAQFPNPDEFFSAQGGGLSALRRAQVARKTAAGLSAPSRDAKKKDRSGPSVSLMSFHPSIERRLKRLARMGAHPDLKAADPRTWIVGLVIGLILSPFLIAIIAGFLLLISIMTVASITFLLVWMAFIHKAFTLLPHATGR